MDTGARKEPAQKVGEIWRFPGHETVPFCAFYGTSRTLEEWRVASEEAARRRRNAFVSVYNAAPAPGAPTVTGSVLDKEDIADPDAPLSIALVAEPARGVLDFRADGTFTYDPGHAFDYLFQGQMATETFTYTVTDADGDTVKSAVSITVTGTPDGPVPSLIVYTPALAMGRCACAERG